MSTRLIAGCMTGTSLDGLDAALVTIEGHGLDMSARFVRAVARPLGALAEPLRRLAGQQPMTAGDIARISRDFALLHADVLRDLAESDELDLICAHGQTVFHQPAGFADAGPRNRRPVSSGASWQLLNPFPIAHALHCPVVYDLRAADIAAGGQGAPVTPIADWVLFRGVNDPMTVVNLGGFCNYTQWRTDVGADEDPSTLPWFKLDHITGGDVCVCNQLLDALARGRLGLPFDADGRVAAAGVADPTSQEVLQELLRCQSGSGRSLGTGDELLEWSQRFGHLRTSDLLRTACEAIAQTIVERVTGRIPILVAGGGVRNQALLGAIRQRAPLTQATDHVGLPAAFREAAEFAVLGALCQDQIPITLPHVTGVPVPAPISGAWVFP